MPLHEAAQLLTRHGFSQRAVLPDGRGDVCIVAEAPGATEDASGIPLHPEAEAGGLFKRLMERVGVTRDRFTITNCVWQRPPSNELAGCSYEQDALDAWWPQLQALIRERKPKAILLLGGTALRQFTHFQSILTTRGYAHHLDLEGHDCPLVATYHPSFLNHGQQHLSGVFIHDVLLALELARSGWALPALKTIPTPSISEFQRFAEGYDPLRHRLTFDIETPESEGVEEDVVEEDLSRISFHITRMSFCYDSAIGGISIPWQEPFITPAKQMLASTGPKRSWNGRLFDRPRLERNGCVLNGREYDLMDQWRHLHRTLPASVAFVAPFYLRMPPYKHLAHYQPEWYSAMDAIVEHEIAEGMERDMRQMGQWDTYERHVVDIISHHGVCSVMGRNGLPYSAEAAAVFGKELEQKRLARVERMQEIVPEHLKPVKQKAGLKRMPKDATGYVKRTFMVAGADLTKVEVERLGLTIINDTFKYAVERWALLEEFNPASHLQVKALIKHFGHKVGKDRKSKNETSNDDTLRKLISTHLESPKESNQLAVEAYRNIREVRALSKVLGTYVMGWKPGADGRIHATPGVWGDMFRVSWRDPNIAATVADKKEQQIAAGFRKCVCVSDDEWLIESDWKGMEAVLVGYFAEDPDYMRLARLGVHDYMALHMIGQPIELGLPEDELKDRFSWVKKNHPKIRDDAKHTIHGTNYGMTPFLMAELYEMSRSRAAQLQSLYFELFPKVRAWQQRTISQAHSETKLVNAWAYRMDFWNVYKWEARRYDNLRRLWVRKQTGALGVQHKRDLEQLKRIETGIASGLSSDKAIARLCYSLGDEAKSAISFLPRDSGAAMLKDALLELEERYQLASRGIIRGCAHDSILGVCKRRDVDWVAEALRAAQERPVERLNGLVIGVEQAIGQSWDKKSMVTYERSTNEQILAAASVAAPAADVVSAGRAGLLG
jgi:uracil-DNA glycosylase family 4